MKHVYTPRVLNTAFSLIGVGLKELENEKNVIPFNTMNNIEIIGNIYSNPELLN